jgi:AraC-like DNA-binding protein/Tfp pilus assembly protein PilF
MRAIYFSFSKLVIFLFLLLSSYCYANETDSLTQQLKVTKGIDKLVLLNKLILKDIYTDPVLSGEYAGEMMRLAVDTENDSMISKSYYNLGLSYYFRDFWTLASDNFILAINSKWGSRSEMFTARCSNNVGICFEYMGEYEKAAHYYYNAIKASENLGDTLLTARTRLNLGMLYFKMKDETKAKKMFLASLPVFIKYNDDINVINAYQNLFLADGILGNLNESEKYFNKAKSLALLLNDSTKLMDIYLDYGVLLSDHEDYMNAKYIFQQALNYSRNKVKGITNNYILYCIGKNEMYLGNLDSATVLLTNTYKGFQDMNSNAWLTNVELSLSKLYARKGNFILSDKFLKEALEREKTMFEEKKVKSISEMEVKYETDKKEQALVIQNLQITSQQKQIILISFMAFLFATALVIVLFMIKKIRVKNRNLFERNKELTSRWEKLKSCGINTNNETDSEIYSRIAELMNRELLYRNPELTVDYISKKINSNTKYVSGAIKQKTGMNFNTYINTHRIEEAKKILLDAESKTWSLDAVAVNCGFNNPTTFYINFKKYTGLTPASYRNIG